MNRFGFVYVLQNDFMNGLYKVGMTERSPSQRAIELSRGTGVPEQYAVAYYAEVENPGQVERQVHEALAGYRVNESREFFRCPLIKVMRAIEDTGELLTDYLSDIAHEARSPGTVFGSRPLAFEQSLYTPGELIAIVERGYAS